MSHQPISHQEGISKPPTNKNKVVIGVEFVAVDGIACNVVCAILCDKNVLKLHVFQTKMVVANKQTNKQTSKQKKSHIDSSSLSNIQIDKISHIKN
jgi:hypothetical protein